MGDTLRSQTISTELQQIAQQAVEMLLSPIYEQIFYNFSMGFRKGRSQHQAIHKLRESCRNLNINWIISADITGLFDNINHELLKDLVRLKANDGRIIQLIGKWLNAGVMENDRTTYPDKGTPQGQWHSFNLKNNLIFLSSKFNIFNRSFNNLIFF